MEQYGIKDREDDKNLLMSIPMEKLMELTLLHIRNLWTVDGLYFLNIEKKFNTERATEIDRNVWATMGKLEAQRLKIWLGEGCRTLHDFMYALSITSWALYNKMKKYELKKNTAVMRVARCRIQCARRDKNLPEFPCREVRYGFLKEFAREFNPNIRVECIVCPPGPHNETVWCEWKFTEKT